jgi:hypothetical protein
LTIGAAANDRAGMKQAVQTQLAIKRSRRVTFTPPSVLLHCDLPDLCATSNRRSSIGRDVCCVMERSS